MSFRTTSMGESSKRRATSLGGQETPDRFIPSRPPFDPLSLNDVDAPPHLFINTPPSAIGSQITQSTSLPNMKKRILSYNPSTPRRYTPYQLDEKRRLAVSADASTSTPPKITRKPPYTAYMVLDAPGYQDNYYLNLVDWSSRNQVAVGLDDHLGYFNAYVYDAKKKSTTRLVDGPLSKTPITSVSWSPDGRTLAVGLGNGGVEIWDVEKEKRTRTILGQSKRIGSLSWTGDMVSSGSQDGTIWHNDVRMENHKVMVLPGHKFEVCGLKWRPDGALLASGGNDNTVKCWDLRLGESILPSEINEKIYPRWTGSHTAAVKALAWCPWQPSVLASGGGKGDDNINLWSTTTTGNRIKSLSTGSQVTSLIFSTHSKELLSTHGYPGNSFSVWTYPKLEKVYDREAHACRVLCSALSPDGCSVVTAAADETLKFWKVWERPGKDQAVKEKSSMQRMLSGIR